MAPGVTVVGDNEQLARLEGPVTPQEREMTLEKPPCAAKVRTSVPCELGGNASDGLAGLTEKSGGGLNVAVTDWAEFMVTLHIVGSVPVHAPLHPAKSEGAMGTAVSETDVPGNNNAEQVPPVFAQLMPPELLVTLPLPLPVTVTLSVTPGTKFAVTELSMFIVITQGLAFPEHTPVQLPNNKEFELGITETFTELPARYVAEQVPGQLMAPLIPAGIAWTVPVGSPVSATVSV